MARFFRTVWNWSSKAPPDNGGTLRRKGASLRSVAWLELVAFWVAWWYPFLFRAPHIQKRPSITVTGPTRVGLLLEAAAFGLAFLRESGTPRTSTLALLGAGAFGVVGVVLAWRSIQHLGKQFRVHAGLYDDHELVRTGPYAIVRHPIYAALLALLITTMLLLTSWTMALVSLALFVAGTETRIQSEDGLLASRFGAEFAEYRKRVWAYVPFVR